ncbi:MULTISPECIES: XRE family transcriptional regulator [Aerococcus]|nr:MULTISPECIES: XRE family transcriptional regulator [Aerococcus]MDK6368487.1 XRE family transcriptional regulator [Aerococcus sp. UMB9870]MDK6679570.1 XRE family transcriptional regulator [Aerococcus sp. UMB8608]MDK6686414.1 XRE family transcriptional regulator [Aerococcus sp. UMB8623]MDK6940964.1 XRE family transcriptional regulator [Aerococcus sp. UMB8487]OFK22085.1 hypothetical protein HMPREF2829_00180 [Aerococcus sp. HMSC072A12]
MFNSNLKYLRNKFGLQQEELANQLGRKSGSTISEWEKGTYTPKIKVLSEIASIFNVDLDDLMNKDLTTNDIESIIDKITDTVKILSPTQQNKVYSFAQAQKQEHNEDIIREDSNTYLLSDYQDLLFCGPVSAETGEWLDSEHQETISLPTNILPNTEFDFVVQVDGDSMEPMFRNDEYIFVRKATDIRTGQIGIFSIDSEAYLRKAYIDDDQLRLVSLNDKYDDLIFKNYNAIQLIGSIVL